MNPNRRRLQAFDRLLLVPGLLGLVVGLIAILAHEVRAGLTLAVTAAIAVGVASNELRRGRRRNTRTWATDSAPVQTSGLRPLAIMAGFGAVGIVMGLYGAGVLLGDIRDSMLIGVAALIASAGGLFLGIGGAIGWIRARRTR